MIKSRVKVTLGLGLRVRVSMRVFADVFYGVYYYYYYYKFSCIGMDWSRPVKYNRPILSTSCEHQILFSVVEGLVSDYFTGA